MSKKHDHIEQPETTKAERIVRILTDDESVSPQEKRQIRRWLLNESNEREKIKALEAAFDDLFKFNAHPVDAKRLWPELAKRLNIDPDAVRKKTTADPVKTGIRMPLRRRMALRVAAVLIPILVIAGVSTWFATRDHGRIVAGQTKVAFVDGVVVATAEGEQKLIDLPDGSRVWVNGNSRLQYESDFTANRTVALSGEAYFSVEHAGGQPFTVVAGGVKSIVTGTEFNVRAYEADRSAEVTLHEGSLNVAIGKDEWTLAPSDRLTFDIADASVSMDKVAIEKADEWRGEKQFSDAPLSEVLQYIADRYNVEMTIEGRLDPTEKTTTKIRMDTDLRTILEVLKMSQRQFDYEIAGNKVTVRVQ